MTEQSDVEYLKSFGLTEAQAHQLSAGVDIMRDAGYSQEKIETTLGAALKQGLNPEQIARKMVSFSQILKNKLTNGESMTPHEGHIDPATGSECHCPEPHACGYKRRAGPIPKNKSDSRNDG